MDFFVEGRVQVLHQVHDGRLLRGLPAVVAEGALCFGPVAGGAEGGKEHDLHHMGHEVVGFRAAVGELHGHQGICHAEEAKAQGAPVVNAFPVLVQGLGIIAVVHNFVQRRNTVIHHLFEPFLIEQGMAAELIIDHFIEVHAAQVAGVVGVASEFTAGIGDFDFVFIVPRQEMAVIEPVHEQGPRIAPVPLGLAEFPEKFPGSDGLPDFFSRGFHGEMEGVLPVVPDSFHEFIGEKDGNIHGRQFFLVLLDVEEFINVRMIAVQPHHHGAPAAILADYFAGDIENLQERNGARRSAGHISHHASLRAEVGNIDADAAAIRKDAGDFIVRMENGFQVILRGRKDVAVRQGHPEFSLRPRRIEGPSRRTEGCIFQVPSYPFSQIRIKYAADPVHKFLGPCFAGMIVFFFQYSLTDGIIVPVFHMECLISHEIFVASYMVAYTICWVK